MIDALEEKVGIDNDGFMLTQSFVDFQFDSSGPIRNLQIMFLAMIVLIAIPICMLILKMLFFWCKKVQYRINQVNSAMFFNVYIRFGLETYLELCLSSLLRF